MEDETNKKLQSGGNKKSKTEMTASASIHGNKSKHTRGSNERYLIRTGQNNGREGVYI